MDKSKLHEDLVEELTGIIKEFGKPARIVHGVRTQDDDEDEFLEKFLELLNSDLKPGAKDEKSAGAAKEEKPADKEASPDEKDVAEGDFAEYVGGMLVDAVEVEDDGEGLYYCIADDDAFYIPKALFEKYFVKVGE